MMKRFDFHGENNMKRISALHGFVSVLLCLIMMLTSMPMTASAGSLDTAVAVPIPVSIGGVLEEPFNFVKDSNYQIYNFAIMQPPSGLQTYEWSLKGTLPDGLSLMDSDAPEAYIGGAATEATDEPVALTVSVRATASNGDVYYGEADILIGVYVYVDPYEDAENL